MEKINSVLEDDRMRVVWSLVPNIPQDIIFSTTPTLTAKGFGWAPATFLTNDDIISSSSEFAERTDDGLKVQFLVSSSLEFPIHPQLQMIAASSG